MSALAKVKPESKLQTVRLNQHAQGVDLIIGFDDGYFNLMTLTNQLDRDIVGRAFRSLALDLSDFEIH